MPAHSGIDLIIARGDGGAPTEAFVTYGSFRSKTFSLSANEVDVTSDSDVDGAGNVWRTFFQGARDMPISGDGILKSASESGQMFDDLVAGTRANWRLTIPSVGKTITAPMHVTAFEITGTSEAEVSFSATLRLAGAPTVANV